MASRREAQQWAKRDAQLAQALGDRSARVGRSGKLAFSASIEAVMNAVNTEGREVLSADAKGYWDDMRRRYPWTDPGSRGQIETAAKLRNRLGRVKQRTIYHGDGRTPTVLEASR